MALVNEHLLKLPDDYFSPVMERKINLFKAVHPKADLICLEKEDVCLPVPGSVAGAMARAVEELADASSFRGYGPKQGYDFLIESIVKYWKSRRYSSPRVRRATSATSAISSVTTTASALRAWLIRFMRLPASCADGPGNSRATADGIM